MAKGNTSQTARVYVKAFVGQATKAIKQVKDQLLGLEKKAGTASKGMARLGQFATKLKGPMIGLTVAVVALKGAMNFVKQTAEIETARRAFEASLSRQGVAIDGYIAKLQEMSKGQISVAEIMKVSSRAFLLGIPAEKMAELMEIATASANAMGISVQKAFSDMATGIGRQSPMILDNLGIIMRTGPAYEAYAASIGKTVEALDAQERKLAIVNNVIENNSSRIATLGNAQSETALAIARLTAALENQAMAYGGSWAKTADNFLYLTTDIGKAQENVSDSSKDAAESQGIFSEVLDIATRAMQPFNAGLGDSVSLFNQWADSIREADKAAAHHLEMQKIGLATDQRNIELMNEFIAMSDGVVLARMRHSSIMDKQGPLIASEQNAVDLLSEAYARLWRMIGRVNEQNEEELADHEKLQKVLDQYGLTTDQNIRRKIEETEAEIKFLHEQERTIDANGRKVLGYRQYSEALEQAEERLQSLKDKLNGVTRETEKETSARDKNTSATREGTEAKRESIDMMEEEAVAIKGVSEQLRELIALRAAADASVASRISGPRRTGEVMSHEAAAWGLYRQGTGVDVPFIGSKTSASEDWQAIYGGHGSRLDVPSQPSNFQAPVAPSNVNKRSARSGFSASDPSWQEMSLDQRKRYITMGGKPEPAQIGWVEVRGS